MLIIDNYIGVLKKYATFEGRATRTEFWYFVLANLALWIPLLIIVGLIGDLTILTIFGVVAALYGLAITIPGLAVSVRRLHDVGKSGWWFFIQLVPAIGPLWYLFLLASPSQTGSTTATSATVQSTQTETTEPMM